MKKIRLHNLMVALMLVCTAGFWSCSNDDVDSDGPFITPKPTSLTFDASGDNLTKGIAIESNREWTAAFVESGVDSWISIDKKAGSGNGTINVTVLPNDGVERTATLKLTASTASTSLKITQYAEGGSSIGEILYQENCGTSVEKGPQGWPYVDQYDGWERGGTLDQSTVTYSGNKSTVANSGADFAPGDGTPFSGAPYVGMNTAASEFVINGVNITGNSNFTFKFGAIFQSNYVDKKSVFSPVEANSFALSVSVNGTDWAPLTYTVEQQGGGNWYMVTAAFKVPDGATKLYIKYATSNLQANQGYRFDDFTLYEGGNGSMIDPGTDPGDKTYITVAELRAKGEVTISENLYVKASVISNKEGGNSIARRNVVISDGEAGIAIRFTVDADYAVGTELELALNGAQLAKFSGLLQLNNFNNAKATATGEIKIIPAKEVTAADIVAGTYESMYVAVPDVEVIAADLSKKMIEGGVHTNIGMEAKTGQNFSMFSAKYSVFKDVDVPQGSGTLKGIAGVYVPDGGTADYQVAPQTAADFEGLTGPRFGGEATFSFGTPEFTATTIQAGAAIVGGKITIPYMAATGTETYNITVAVSGDAAAGIDPITTAVTKTLSEGNGSIELPITGTPTTAGSVTFTINGIAELTANTVVAVIPAAGGNLVYETGFEDSDRDPNAQNDYKADKEFTLSGVKWQLRGSDLIKTGSPAVGSWHWTGRIYKNETVVPSLWSDQNLTTATGEITTVDFKAAGVNTVKLQVLYSVDNGSTWANATLANADGSAWDGTLAAYKDYTATINTQGAVKIKFTYSVDEVNGSNRDVKLDAIVVHGTK